MTPSTLIEALGKPAPTPAVPATVAHADDLTPLEIEVIELFVQVARLMALPKSTAEIYGLIFIAERPVPMDDLTQKLHLSKGSASQGLKFLREIGAVRAIYVPGDRRDHYGPEMDLRNLIVGFLKEKISPHLDNGQNRLSRLEALLGSEAKSRREHLGARVATLRRWEKTSRNMVPLLVKLLGR